MPSIARAFLLNHVRNTTEWALGLLQLRDEEEETQKGCHLSEVTVGAWHNWDLNRGLRIPRQRCCKAAKSESKVRARGQAKGRSVRVVNYRWHLRLDVTAMGLAL